MTKFTFIIATQASAGAKLPIHEFINSVKPSWADVQLKVVYGNHEGLSKVYNDNIDKDSDFNICIHDDVYIQDINFYSKLVNSEYDLIGIAGGMGWRMKSKPNQPNIWTKATEDFGASGWVVHFSPDGKTKFASSYGPAPLRTLTLDGQFLVLTKHAVEVGLRFDEQFKFHYYDMDLCFQAYKYKLVTGTSGIHLEHKSRGESVLQPEFLQSQEKFMTKWGFTYA